MSASPPIESPAVIITKPEWQLQAVLTAYNTLPGFFLAAISLVVGLYLTILSSFPAIIIFLLPVIFVAAPYIGTCIWFAWALWRRRPWAIVAFAVICLLNVLFSFFWPGDHTQMGKAHYVSPGANVPPPAAAAFVSHSGWLIRIPWRIADVLNVIALLYVAARWVHIAGRRVLVRSGAQQRPG